MQALDFTTAQNQPTEVREDSFIPAGEHNISLEITVFPKAKLVIEAGATLRFSKFAGLTVLGKLRAVGTADNIITFAGRGRPSMVICGTETEGTEIAHASITGGRGRIWTNEFTEDGCPVYGKSSVGQETTGGALQIRGTKNITISLAHVSFTDDGYLDRGGAIFVEGSALKLEKCSFEGNRAAKGGALCALNSVIALDACKFRENGSEQHSGSGGAIAAIGASGILNACTFTKHNELDGAAVSCQDSPLQFQSCIFDENHAADQGGAVKVTGKVGPQLTRCTFTGNRADSEGGAFHFVTEQVKPSTLSHCTFQGNTTKEKGGALYLCGTSAIQLTECTFSTNRGADEPHSIVGGAIYCGAGARLVANKCRFENNQAQRGGVIAFGDAAVDGTGSGALISLSGSTFKCNSVTAAGGAISAISADTLDVSDSCKFIDNRAGTLGGAISLGGAAKGLLISADFLHNSAQDGGAVCWQGQRGRLESCTFERNEAMASGGALASYSTTMVRDCRFVNNLAKAAGGAIWCSDSDTVINSSVFNNNTCQGSPSGGAIRCEKSDGEYQDENTFAKNTPNNVAYQDKSYPAPSAGKKAGKKGRCWVVTAYYGDPDHPDVAMIRALRDSLLDDDPLHPLVTWINAAYLYVGRTPAGRWWAEKTAVDSLPRRLTGPLCAQLYRLACRVRNRADKDRPV